MKILLIYTNQNRYLAPPPIGLTYLIPPLKKYGHQVSVLDLMLSDNPKNDLINIINEFKPQIAGFSIRNLDNQYMLKVKNNLPEIKEYVSLVKNKGIVTVIGGSAFSTFPSEMLEYMNADYGINGQGEGSFLTLVNSIEQNKIQDNILGLVRKKSNLIVQNLPSLDGYSGKESDWSLINVKQYKRWSILTPNIGVVIKTGCPYKCIYCDTRMIMGNKFLLRNADEIIDDLKKLKTDFKIKTFFFNAICLNSPLDYIKNLLLKIINEKINIRFMGRLYPIRNAYDEEFIKFYKKAGGYFAMVDFGSFSDTMLRNYKKPFDKNDIIHFNQLCKKNGLKFGAELLFGGFGENEKTIKESMDFLPEVNYSFAEYAIGIRITPNTEMFDIAKKEGIVQTTKDLLFSRFYVSKELDVEWAKEYIHKSLRKYFYRYLKMPPIIIKNFLTAI
jgi:radical SAM superfamily enzyme YgiQ (UPF0313 family)